MESERYQKELFEFEKPRKTKPKFAQIFRKSDFAASLSAEKIVFITIGIMMLMVIFFALGVEKGKSLAAKASSAGVSVECADTTPIVVREASVTEAQAPVSSKAPVETPKAQAPIDKNKPYTIVAAAFSREAFALTEVGRLKSKGLNAFVYYSDPYYLACVG